MNKIKTIIIVLLLSQNTVFSQVVNFGSLTNYIFFTSAGAHTNAGQSKIAGNIGSAFGVIALPGATHYGNVYNENTPAVQAKLYLTSLCSQFIPNTDSHGRRQNLAADITFNAEIRKINRKFSISK